MSTAPIRDYEEYDDFEQEPEPYRFRKSVSTKEQAPKKSVKKKPARFVRVLEFLCILGLTAAVTFWFSVLMGRSLSETAQRDIGKYNKRAKASKAESDEIRRRLDRVANPKKVSDWAQENGFMKEGTGSSQ